MHYWERWIGDWKRKTAHLSLAEKGAYGELLDHQYAHELHVLPTDHRALYRIAGATDKDECAALDSVMKQFYERTEDGYANKRASQEITKRFEFVSKQRDNANRRWSKPDAHGEVKPRGNGHDVAEAAIENIPLKDGTQFPITRTFATELERLFPNVDAFGTFREIRAWALGKQQSGALTDMWTKRGAGSAISSWFKREQEAYAQARKS